MPSIDDHFRALMHVHPPNHWPDVDELHLRRPAPPRAHGRRFGVIALALALAAAGLVVTLQAFRTEERPPAPASPVENGQIVFARGGQEAGLYVVNPDGTGLTRVTSREVDTDPAWSPDGTRLAIVRGFWGADAGIYVMNSDGTGVGRLALDAEGLVDGTDLGPAWSPDGSRIAFAREGREEGAETGNADIYVVDADGTDLVRLTNGPVIEYEPSWSPGGARIAFEGYDLASGGQPPSNVRLYVMHADGTGVTELGPENVQGPAWSPDGSEIAYVDTETGSIMSIRSDGTARRRILDVAELVGGVHLVYDVAWSPDGTRLAFMAGPDSESTHIYVVDRDGSNVVQVTDGPAPDASPAWQPVLAGGSPTPAPSLLPEGTVSLPPDAVPEGTLLLWTEAGAEIISAGSERSRLVPGISTPLDLSSDGSMVLGSNYSASSSAHRLLSVDLHTGEGTVLVRTEGEDVLGAFAQWSPDGSMVAYTAGSQDPAERSTLCVLTLHAAEPQCFPGVGRVFTFDWSPDGGRLVVAGPGAQPVRTLDAATGALGDVVPQQGDTTINEAIRNAGMGTSGQLVGPEWSPSGMFLAALANLEDSKFAYVPVVFSLDGEVVALGRPSGEFPEPFEWSSVSDALVYTRGQAPYRITEAYLLDPATGDEQTLAHEGDAPFVLRDLAWSPSGRWLATMGYVNRGGGYFETQLRILDTAQPASFREIPFDAGEAVNFFVDWAS